MDTDQLVTELKTKITKILNDNSRITFVKGEKSQAATARRVQKLIDEYVDKIVSLEDTPSISGPIRPNSIKNCTVELVKGKPKNRGGTVMTKEMAIKGDEIRGTNP